jgi:hypothetical protein
MSIKDTVLAIIAEGVTDNEEIARLVQQRCPGAATTAASVSSIKSNARRSGELTEAMPVSGGSPIVHVDDLPEADEGETEEEVTLKLTKRFDTMDRMAGAVIRGILPALIISGPAGLGKSFPMRRMLKTASDGGQDVDIVSGSISAPGLYEALWNMRNGGVLMLDDCDDIFKDLETLNILKAALDSGDTRTISWRKQSSWLEALGIDNSFDFEGRVIFISNIDFEQKIEQGSAMSPHFQALIDRSLYLSIGIRTVLDYTTRIKMIALDEKMLEKNGLTPEEAEEIVAHVIENRARFYHLSLRLVHQVGVCFMADRENWKDDVEVTKMRTL